MCKSNAILIAAVASALFAAGKRPAGADDLLRFIELNQCPIVERLKLIDETTWPWMLNRFIVVAIEGGGQRYVQCLFNDDASLLCEASSGWYGPEKGEKGHLRLAAAEVEALWQLGFDTTVPEGNYQQIFDITGEESFAMVARGLLSALYQGYGAWSGTALEIYAPLALELPPDSCMPVG